MKSFILFIVKTTVVYGIIAFVFSLIGFTSSDGYVVGNPIVVSGLSYEHITGHIVWGLVAGIASFSLRYAIIAGFFPLVLDSDHILQFLDIEMIPRMAHSIPFACVAVVVMILIFGRKDLRLIAISFTAIFSHMSLDIFLGSGWAGFPLFTPFTNEFFIFTGNNWIIFELITIIIIGTTSVIVLIKEKKKRVFSL